jgi:hypothetical protein
MIWPLAPTASLFVVLILKGYYITIGMRVVLQISLNDRSFIL